MSGIIARTIQNPGAEMAEVLGPIIGEAIRIQIRSSRKAMVEALYPIIGESVQRAIAEFSREFQRNIDSCLRATFSPERVIRAAQARWRGISPSELALFPIAFGETPKRGFRFGTGFRHWIGAVDC